MYKISSTALFYILTDILETGKLKAINKITVFYPEMGHKKGKQASIYKKVISDPHLKNKGKFITNCGKADKSF